MKEKAAFKSILIHAANLAILVVQAITFAYIWYTFYQPLMREVYFARGNYAVIGLYVLIMFFFTKVLGGYRIGYLRIAEVLLGQIISIILGNFVAYFLVCLVVVKYVWVVPLLVIALIQIGFVIPWVIIFRRMYVRMYPASKMIVVYGEYSPVNLIKKINSRTEKYNICASISYHEGFDKLCDAMTRYEAVVLCDLPTSVRNQILKFCYHKSLRTYITPKLSDIIITGASKIHMFDSPLYLTGNSGLSWGQRFTKRALDIVVASVSLAICSPFFLITAICIKMYDHGPIFYKQTRVTINHREFQIIKFRSMKVTSEAESGARLAAKDDDRVTPIGKLIRSIHFDEIPQLLNILKGEMSFVGPRPERPEIGEEYEKIIPEFSFRLKVKAGLTGYAQVYGKYNTTPYDKLKLDLTYIENYSFWMDIKLILMTVKVIFKRGNSEGVNADQKTALIKDGDESFLKALELTRNDRSE